MRVWAYRNGPERIALQACGTMAARLLTPANDTRYGGTGGDGRRGAARDTAISGSSLASRRDFGRFAGRGAGRREMSAEATPAYAPLPRRQSLVNQGNPHRLPSVSHAHLSSIGRRGTIDLALGVDRN